MVRKGKSFGLLNSKFFNLAHLSKPHDITIKKILVLSTDAWLDRLHGASIIGLFKALTRLKYQIKVILPSTSNKIVESGPLSVIGLKVKRYIPIFTSLSLYWRSLRYMLNEGHLVLIFDFPMLPLFLLGKILRKSRGIMLILSRPLGEKGFLGMIRFFLFRLSLILGKFFVNAFTAITPFEASQFCSLGKIPNNKIIVVPSPLGEQFVEFDFLEDANKLRLKLGLDMTVGKKLLLYHGVLDEKRGVLKLVELFHKLFEVDDRITLLLVGDGPAREDIKRFIQRNKVKNIIFLGPIPYLKMPEVVGACDIGLVLLPDHPWWRYQCPTKLIEFLALGKLVIASDLPGIRWVARNSPLVYYLGELSRQCFEEAIRKVLTHKGSSKDRLQTRLEMIDRFSTHSLALKLDEIVESLRIQHSIQRIYHRF